MSSAENSLVNNRLQGKVMPSEGVYESASFTHKKNTRMFAARLGFTTTVTEKCLAWEEDGSEWLFSRSLLRWKWRECQLKNGFIFSDWTERTARLHQLISSFSIMTQTYHLLEQWNPCWCQNKNLGVWLCSPDTCNISEQNNPSRGCWMPSPHFSEQPS